MNRIRGGFIFQNWKDLNFHWQNANIVNVFIFMVRRYVVARGTKSREEFNFLIPLSCGPIEIGIEIGVGGGHNDRDRSAVARNPIWGGATGSDVNRERNSPGSNSTKTNSTSKNLI